MKQMRRRFQFLLILGLAGSALMAVHLYAPPRWLPWKPLDLADPPGFWTRWKLSVLEEAPLTCRAVVRHGGLETTLLPDRVTGEGCGFDNVMAFDQSPTTALTPARPNLSCPMIAATELWLRDVVQPAAQTHFGKRVTSVQHVGTYHCRNIAGSRFRSEHSYANAIDIVAFRLENGRVISVLNDWNGALEAQAFLRDVRDGACDIFSVTLSPDYNAAHRDHFHFDLGLMQRCG